MLARICAKCCASCNHLHVINLSCNQLIKSAEYHHQFCHKALFQPCLGSYKSCAYDSYMHAAWLGMTIKPPNSQTINPAASRHCLSCHVQPSKPIHAAFQNPHQNMLCYRPLVHARSRNLWSMPDTGLSDSAASSL